MAIFNIPVTDFGGENSSAAFPVADAAADLDLTALFAAVDAIVLGNLGQSTLNLATPKDAGPGGASADPWATRKARWLCRYHDAITLRKYTLELATPDLDELASGTDFADLGAGAGLAFKSGFENLVKARRTGNAVVLDSVELRGRDIKNKKN